MGHVSSHETWFKQPSRLLAGSGIEGLMVALIIIGAWFCHLIYLFSSARSAAHPAVLLAAVLLQTFLNTGLFITVHDSIHGLVYPASPLVNHLIGGFCSRAYAFLSYKALATKHCLHHCYPMSEADPDFHHSRNNSSFLTWYFYFMRQYCGWKQLVWLASTVGIVIYLFHLSPIRILIFWGIPLLFSSLQLFYFGTYWPHQNVDPNSNHCARSLNLPWFISFLACYHFGYHQEHHERPDIPWWQLPNVVAYR